MNVALDTNAYSDFLRGVPLSAPQRPYLANLSGDWVDAAT